MQIKLFIKVRYISSVTILYGVTLLLLWQGFAPLTSVNLNTPRAQAQTEFRQPIVEHTQRKKILNGVPQRILIPKVAIDNDVLPGNYDVANQTWSITDLGIHFAQPSSLPNDTAGNTLIYAHNNNRTFGKLTVLRIGDTVQIITQNNLKFTYTFVSSKDFDPQDTSVFFNDGPPTLVLQTCSGYFNQYRRLYSFNLQTVEKL